MPTFDVDVENATYEVDAPDERTAWAWANIEHKKQKETVAQDVQQMREGGAVERFGRGALANVENIGYGLKGLFSDLAPEEQRDVAVNKAFLEGTKGEGIRAENLGSLAADIASFAVPGGLAVKGARALPIAMRLAKSAPVIAPLAGEAALGAGLSAAYAPEDRGTAAALGGVGGAAGYGLTRALGKVFGRTKLSDKEKARAKLLEITPEEKRSNLIPEMESYAPSMMEKERTTAEFLGPQAERLLGSLGRKAGTTEDQLYSILSARKAERTQRLVDDFAKETNTTPSAAYGDLEKFIEDKKQIAAPLYEQANQQGVAYTDKLKDFMNDPDIKSAFKTGIDEARRKSLGGTPINWTDYAITGFNEAGDPIIGTTPTWRTWDLVKRGIDKKINAGKTVDPVTRTLSFTDEAKDLMGVKKALLNELDNYAEASGNNFWKEARKESADYLEAKEAFGKGSKYLTSGSINEKQFADALAKYEGSSLEALKGGVANDLFNKAQNNRLSTRTLTTPRIKEKLNLLFGEDAANNLIKRLEIEADMARFESKRMPGAGSPTEEYRQAMGEVTSGPDYSKIATDAAKFAIDAKTMGLGSLATKYIGRPLVNTMSAWDRRGLNQEAQNELGRMLMLSPEKLASELKSIPAKSKTRGQIIQDYLRRVSPYTGVLGAEAASSNY